MGGGTLFSIVSVIAVVVGAIITYLRREKIKDTAEIVKAALDSAVSSLSPTDDTPGRLTPAEIGEIIEAAGAKAKEVLRDA